MTILYLHIGTEKTGTTSIQRFLRANRELLRARGVLFPLAPGDQNHTALTVAAQKDRKRGPLRTIFQVRTPEDVRWLRERLVSELRAEVQAADYSIAVMSNEHCSSRLVEEPDVARLRDLISGLFEAIYVVVYIRRQDELLLSSYSTGVKSGSTAPLRLPAEKALETRYNHWNLLSLWSAVFGRERIICRKFEDESLVAGNVIDDFLDAVGLDSALPFLRPENLNESLDAVTLEFLRLFNRNVPRLTEDGLNPLRDNVVPLLSAISDGPLLTLPQDELSRFMAQFASSNRKVALEYFGSETTGSDDPLFGRRADNRARTEQGNLTVERAVEICAWLWQQKQTQINSTSDRLARKAKKHWGGSPARNGAAAGEQV